MVAFVTAKVGEVFDRIQSRAINSDVRRGVVLQGCWLEQHFGLLQADGKPEGL